MQTWVWTWGGNSFGFIDREALYTWDGRHVGFLVEDGMIFSPADGRYLGELGDADRLITRVSRLNRRRGPRMQRMNRMGRMMRMGYQEFPAPEEL
jgi:hypothetical protein